MFKIAMNDLRAISLFMAKKDIRYYLRGIAINDSHIVTTNGAYLAALPIESDDDNDFIIPSETLVQLFKSVTVHAAKNVVLTITNNSISFGNTTYTYTPIDHSMVNWRLVVTEHKTPVNHSRFNFEHLALFQKAAKLMGCDYCDLIPNGLHAARVEIPKRPEFIGVIMPIKTD